MKREALLVIDMLNDFVLKGAPLEMSDARMTVPNNGGDKNTCFCGGVFNDLVVPVLDEGKQLIEIEPPAIIRDSVLQQMQGLGL